MRHPTGKMLRRLGGDEKGATAVEYGVMLALVVLVAIVTILVLEGKSKIVFNQVENTIGTFGTINNS